MLLPRRRFDRRDDLALDAKLRKAVERRLTLRPKIAADWAFTEVDRDRRIVLFEDRSTGEIARREWDFGDGTKSSEEYPLHRYAKAGEWTVTLTVEGPDGQDRRIKVWEVVTR